MKILKIRHGDLGLIGIDKLPKGLKKEKTKTLMVGSGGNGHTIDNGEVYFKKENDFVFGYLVAKNTKLFHPEHGKIIKGKQLKEVKLKDGIYELRKQQEIGANQMKPIID